MAGTNSCKISAQSETTKPLNISRLSFDIPIKSEVTPLQARMGVANHAVNDPQATSAAIAMGFGFMRRGLTWTRIEKNGLYDFSMFDQLMADAEAHGMWILWLLAYGHPDYGGTSKMNSPGPKTEADIAAFARYAEAAARHYSGHPVKFEIWNEENARNSLWHDPDDYAGFLKVVVPAIRKGNPDAQITAGGTTGVDNQYIIHLIEMGAADKLNAIAVHPYRNGAPESAIANYIQLRQKLNELGAKHLALWDTEWGYTSSQNGSDGHTPETRKQQAIMAARKILTDWLAGLAISVWYDLRDDGTHATKKEQNFGLISADNVMKPAGQAIKFLIQVLGTGNNGYWVGKSLDGIYCARITQPSGTYVIAWNIDKKNPRMVQLQSDDVKSAFDLYGHQLPLNKSLSKISLDLREEDGPVYFLLN